VIEKAYISDMNDIRDNWFFKQHYTREELETLWEWIKEAGNNVNVLEHKGVWSGFHILDKDMKIDIAGQRTQEDCMNWMRRLGLNIMN
jgi:chemotaxis receptor (MCP) glutamine deamidase CheD